MSPGLHETLLLTAKTRKEIAGTVTYINVLLPSAVYINFVKNIHQIQVLTEPLCRAQANFYPLPNNERVDLQISWVDLHLRQRRFRRIYLSTNPSPHDPQNLLLAQTNRPMKTPGRIFSIISSCQSDLM